MTRSTIASTVAVWTLLAVAPAAHGQIFGPMSPAPATGNIEGFTVAGKGHVAAKPDRLEIDLDVSAASELTADAIVKYRDARKRLTEAFAALKLDNVTLEERGLLVDQKGSQMSPYFFDYQPSRKTKAEVQFTRKLVVVCKDVRKLDEEAVLQLVARLLDVAQDAGGRVGPAPPDYSDYYFGRMNRASGLVRFILDDFEKLEEEAYAKAVADAEARAKRLARLSKVELGPVVSVRETSAPGVSAAAERASDDEKPGRRIESSRYQEIPVKVELLVRFDVKPASENGRRSGDR